MSACAAAVPEVLHSVCPTGGGQPLSLRRAWPRDDRLLLEYTASDGRRAAGQWFRTPGGGPDTARAATVAAETAAAAPTGAVRLAPGALVLQFDGADRRLPTLHRLVRTPGTELLVHRPERRAVVRTAAGAYVKVLRPGRTGVLTAAHRAVVGRLRTPTLRGADDAAGTTTWSPLPGRSLYEVFAADPPAGTTAAARRTGVALRRLHDLTVGTGTVTDHDRAAERGVVARWVALLAAFAPGLAAEAHSVVAHVDGLLARAGGSPAVIHRDFYDRQVIVPRTGPVGILDLDTLAVGPRELDLANALVHLELRTLEGLLAPGAGPALGAALLDGYGATTAVRAGLGPYAAAARLRLSCVYRFRPTPPAVCSALLERLTAPLPGLG